MKKFIKDKRGQWAHPGKNTFIPDANGRITMKGVKQPVFAFDDEGNSTVMQPGGEYQFPGNGVYEIPLTEDEAMAYAANGYIVEEMQEGGPIVKQRTGVRENFDHSVWTPSGEFSKPSSVSSHLMAAEEVPGRGWVGFPTLFQGNPYVENESMLSTNVGEWLDMSDQNNGWWPIYEEADRRGEVYDFGEDKEAAIAFGEGSWKDQLLDEGMEIELSDEEVEQYKAGGYILEELQEGGPIETDKLITYKNNKKLIDGVGDWQSQSDVKISSDYNDQIKARLLTGNFGYNPKTGELVRLHKSERTVVKDKEARETRRALKKLKEMQHKDEAASFKDLYGQEDFQREDFTGNFLSPYAVGHPVLIGKGGPDDKIAKDYRGGLSDLYRYYGGLPLQNNILQYSKTAPTDAKNKNAKYISLNKDQVFLDEVWKNYLRVKSGNLSRSSQGDKEQKVKDGVWRVSGYSSGGPDHHITEKPADKHHSNAIGRYKISQGEDDKGHFIQYYDKFDQATGSGNILTSIYNFVEDVTDVRKPFEIYDRIYYNPRTMERTYKEDFKEGGYILEELAGGGEACPDGYVKDLNGDCVEPDYTGSEEENVNIKDELEAQGYKDETSLLKDAPKGLSMFSLKPGQSVEDLLGSLKEHPFARTKKDKEFIKKNKKDWADFVDEFTEYLSTVDEDLGEMERTLDRNKPDWEWLQRHEHGLRGNNTRGRDKRRNTGLGYGYPSLYKKPTSKYDDNRNDDNLSKAGEIIKKHFGSLSINSDGWAPAYNKKETELKEYFAKKLGKKRYDIDSGSKLLNATLYDTEKSGKYKPLYIDLQKEYDKIPENNPPSQEDKEQSYQDSLAAKEEYDPPKVLEKPIDPDFRFESEVPTMNFTLDDFIPKGKTPIFSEAPMLEELPGFDDGLVEDYVLDRKGNIAGSVMVPAGTTQNRRRNYRKLKRGKLDGTMGVFNGERYDQGGFVLELDENEALEYAKNGYIVEKLN